MNAPRLKRGEHRQAGFARRRLKRRQKALWRRYDRLTERESQGWLCHCGAWNYHCCCFDCDNEAPWGCDCHRHENFTDDDLLTDDWDPHPDAY